MLKEAIELAGLAINCKDLFQWVHSAISSRWPQRDEVLQLEREVNSLSDTLPRAYKYIDRAEWSRHESCVDDLLPTLKDAVYDAEDLLDEFNWYKLKLEVEGSLTQTSPFIDFFRSVSDGSSNKVTDIHKKINDLYNHLDKMGLKLATPPRFDQSVRPETSTGRAEAKIFGREEELWKVIKLLGVPTTSRKRTSDGDPVPTSNQVRASASGSSEAITSISVLPVVGIGGVGKTTLAQSICNHPRVKSHFGLIIWICVSDDFDVKRLTKEAIESSSGEASAENLNVLQKELGNKVKNKRILLVLDDMWDDALKENGECWKRFCDPFTSALCSSMILVTTRSLQVADRVRTIDAFPLQGLKEDVLWNFFKLCVFGSDISEINPELEDIGKALLPKLKGSPLAAKTLGRLLGMRLEPTHWNRILKSELWELKQEKTDILPALELSYIYLPFHLKRCFSFCAAYPKDQTFEGSYLAEIWVAEGFSPAIDIGVQYFEELVNRSFFLKVRNEYVIHDLMHDMIQLVTKDECFVIKSEGDFQKVPINVRHLSVLDSKMSPIQLSEKLCNFTKLRTLLCPSSKAVRMDLWCSKLQRIRAFSCASVRELPESIKNMKHLRYLEISLKCHLSSLPSGFCSLYTLQILYAAECRIESLPSGFSNLINLQQFVSQTFEYHQGQKTSIHVTSADGKEIRLLRDFNQFDGDLSIYFIQQICGDVAADAKLKNKANLNSLTIRSCRDIEVLQVLHPPPNIKSVDIRYYGGVSLPTWFHPRNFQKLTSLKFDHCDRLERISFSRSLWDINVDRHDLPGDNINDSIFASLAQLTIFYCNSLLSLDELLQPAFMPFIKKISISFCQMLVSVPTERFGELQSLEELVVSCCSKINSQHLFAPSLKFLCLNEPGNLADNIECPSLTKLKLVRLHQTCIQLEMWNFPVLKELEICYCGSLKSIDRSGIVHPFYLLTDLSIHGCKELSTIDHLISHEYLPSIERINLTSCEELQYLPTERFRSFRFLKKLAIAGCPSLNWHRGVVFPSSLQELALRDCGDFSAWFPSCLENLVSLESLMIDSCKHLVSIPDHLWTRNLKSLQRLLIRNCPDLVSIGGRRAIAKIKNVTIEDCPVLKEPKQPMRQRRKDIL